jgi:hypothetical protein
MTEVCARRPRGIEWRYRPIHTSVGMNLRGEKEVPSLWLAENEGATFWLSVLTKPKLGAYLPPEDRQAIKAILDGMIVKHRTKQIVGELRS